MFKRLTSFILSLYMMIVGSLYGNTPQKTEIKATTADSVYEYSAGDTFTLNYSFKNVGKPYIHESSSVFKHPTIKIYKTDAKKTVYIYDNTPEVYTADFVTTLIKRGYSYSNEYEIKIPKNTPKGNYTISISHFNAEKEIENFIKVK